MTSSSHARSQRRHFVPAYLVTGLRPNATKVPVLGYFLVVGLALMLGLTALSARLEATTLAPTTGKSINMASTTTLAKLVPVGTRTR